METAKYIDKNNENTIIENFRLPYWFIYPLQFDDTSKLEFEQILILFDWYENKMKDRLTFDLISVSEPYMGKRYEIDENNEIEEEICNFMFASTKINFKKVEKVKIKLFTFVNENEKETFCVFVDKCKGEKLEVYSNINLHSSNYRPEYLNFCRKPTQDERNLFIAELRAIGYNVEEVH